MPPERTLERSFHSLAFKLLGIEGLPLPRINWHLQKGEDGYDDPYLTDADYQTLCNTVCEHVPGMTVQAWRDSTLGQRVAFLQYVLEKQGHRGSGQETTNETLLRDKHVGQLLLLLWNAENREAGVAVVEIPELLQSEALLTACEFNEWIEFGRRNHSHHGGGAARKLILENGWSFTSLDKPNKKRTGQLLHEALTEQVDPEIRMRLRLTYRGEGIASQLTHDTSNLLEVNRTEVDNAPLQTEVVAGADRRFMEMAIEEARKSVEEDDRAHPKVGAVVVKDGVVLATAYRGELGKGEHAEFTALEKKLPDETLAGATVYATLEPCTRRSAEKTPCAQRLIDRRVKKVVIGVLDPNPAICGKGQRLLQKYGIEVKHFDHDLAMQLEELNREWTKVQEAAIAGPATPPPEQPQERASEHRSSAWHEKRFAALETIYNAFCDYLDFLRVALYVKRAGMNVDPMHTFRGIIERQIVYLDHWTAEKIQRYQGELLLFWNWAHESLANEGEAARPKIQERLDMEIPTYLPRVRADVNEVVDREAWREERRRQAGPQLHALLDRIKRESHNFEKLRDGKPPFSEYTEVTPFELLEIDLKAISDLPDYRRLVEDLLAEIARVQAMPRGQKHVTVFLPLIERLEKLLEAEVKGYPKAK